jgi:uncharacterized protein YndB with AHSA1/START domain
MYHICHDIEIHAFVEDIFNQISEPEGLNAWWTVRSSGTAKTNEEFQFYFSDDYDWRAKVLEVSKNESISFQMTKADEDWKNTMLSFEIINKGDHVHVLRFEHRNWNEINAHFRRTSFCWALYLNTLKENAEKKFREFGKG